MANKTQNKEPRADDAILSFGGGMALPSLSLLAYTAINYDQPASIALIPAVLAPFTLSLLKENFQASFKSAALGFVVGTGMALGGAYVLSEQDKRLEDLQSSSEPYTLEIEYLSM